MLELYLRFEEDWNPFMMMEGTKRSVQRVSITAWKDCGGMPREMGVV